MIPIVLAAALVALVRSLVAVRLQRWHIGAPAVMVSAGVLIGLAVHGSIAEALNTESAQHVAEIILAFLLFVDATEIRGGRLWGNSPKLVARVLLIALPLSVALAMLLGAVLFPELSWALLLIIGCVVAPIDFAPSESIVRDRRLSARVRSVLNVEGGYNDGLVSPVFVFALLLASGGAKANAPWDALLTALDQATKAIVVGIVLGGAIAWLTHRSDLAGWTNEQSRRITVVLTPLVAYTAAVAIHGNGFVASFVCGIAFRYLHGVLLARRIRRSATSHETHAPTALTRDFGLIEDVTALMTMTMWFVVGLAAVVMFSGYVGWQDIVFCVAALTVVRIIPVLAALIGSPAPRRDRLMLALLGPRGTTTIVFGLIAYNALPEGDAADTVLFTTVLCVLGSVLLHGTGSSLVIRYSRSAAQGSPPER
ncbi:sodium/proton antiporter (CPA1 family) [Herbihabitans rhizosphaerae]|uniref:Sodium/proton antiporter (CPA1 family) n=1 Tax=Herbihabitans rhizosphaerae TaxID=1872711 RepID=A0A4Q7KBL4_9PSEU|nr:cation:proton antiporter [Herbihabitans rhizosphaerae]RZS29612.1 sodium/proton antiporter (CPA1 family) [Herbihabitans rhizosphaerae]